MEAIEMLLQYNRWRRGEEYLSPRNGFTTLAIGEAIDAACDALERLQWRDISTAPAGPEKFNAWVVAKNGCEWFESECYIDKFGDIRGSHSNLVNEYGRRATHWMPVIPGPNRSEP